MGMFPGQSSESAGSSEARSSRSRCCKFRDCNGSRRRNRYALHGRGAKADTHRIDITVYLAAGRVGRGLFLVEPPILHAVIKKNGRNKYAIM